MMYYIREAGTDRYLLSKQGTPVCYTNRPSAVAAASRTNDTLQWDIYPALTAPTMWSPLSTRVSPKAKNN